uniref:Plasmolipin n=1 Tax=Haplochromis burtoni TaxID=8153 RepID=A0A3Q2WR20_HAPBU
MADFPSKVTTETSVPNSQNSHGGNSIRGLPGSISSRVDFSFIRSIPAMLMIAEIVCNQLNDYSSICPALCSVYVAGRRRVIVMVYFSAATVLYLTAFITNAAYVTPFHGLYIYGHLAAAAFFGAVVTLVYAASAFFSYLDWKGDGGNAATNTVPT